MHETSYQKEMVAVFAVIGVVMLGVTTKFWNTDYFFAALFAVMLGLCCLTGACKLAWDMIVSKEAS